MAARSKRPRVLVADDDAEMIRLLAAKLEQLSCDVLCATDGAAALETLLAEKPDLVILDVMMPKLSGWEVAKEMRRRKRFDRVGLIMLTGIGEATNEATAPAFGADERIDKPFELAELEFKVRKVLSEKRRAGRPEPR